MCRSSVNHSILQSDTHTHKSIRREEDEKLQRNRRMKEQNSQQTISKCKQVDHTEARWLLAVGLHLHSETIRIGLMYNENIQNIQNGVKARNAERDEEKTF